MNIADALRALVPLVPFDGNHDDEKTKGPALAAARAALAEYDAQPIRYVVDGTSEDGTFQGDGENAPFVIFDVNEQTNWPGEYVTREKAEEALASRIVACINACDGIDPARLAAFLDVHSGDPLNPRNAP